jgi:hypothetical protein
MRQIVAEIGIHGIVFTRRYRPMGHGKIEALNKLIRAAFVAEVRASRIRTLDALNEAFVAWMDREYSRTVHGETGEAPIDRWRAGIAHVRYADEPAIERAFQWRERRRADKSGVFSLFGTKYQVGPALARKSIDAVYDPERLEQIEVWHDGQLVERVKPFVVGPHRRPRAANESPPDPEREPTIDWLGHLVAKRRAESFAEEPSPRQVAESAKVKRRQQDDAIVALLADRLDPAVRSDDDVREFLDRYGPFDLVPATEIVDRLIAREGRDQHVRRYLDAIRRRGAA